MWAIIMAILTFSFLRCFLEQLCGAFLEPGPQVGQAGNSCSIRSYFALNLPVGYFEGIHNVAIPHYDMPQIIIL
jgi:hypothetical protein